MPCDFVMLSLYEELELDASGRKEAERHLEGCSDCRRQLEEMRRLRRFVKPALEEDCSLAERSAAVISAENVREDEKQRLERHWSECVSCRQTVSLVREAIAEPPASFETELARRVPEWVKARGGVVSVSEKRFHPRRFWKSAAGVLLAVGISAAVWSVFAEKWKGGSQAGGPSADTVLQEEKRIEWKPGVHLAVSPGAVWSSANGDADIRFDRGSLGVKVEPGQSGIRIRTPLGTVRDIGTVFRVTVFPYSQNADNDVSAPGPHRTAVWVDVEEGLVELTSTTGTKQASAGTRGYLVEDRAPFLKDTGGTQLVENLLTQLEQSRRQNDAARAAMLEALIFSQGRPGEETCRRILEQEETDPESERVKTARWFLKQWSEQEKS